MLLTSLIEKLIKKILPTWMYQRLIGDWNVDGVRKYAKNTGWMFAARGAMFFTSFFTIAIVARYLGPENLGKLSYAQSFVAIISVFATLGISQVLVRDLTKFPERQYELLGTAILSQFVFGILAFFAAIGLSLYLDSEPILTVLIGITAFTFIVNPLGTVNNLFQARVEARYASQITIFLAFFIPLLKLLIIYFDKGIIYFSLILIMEAVISTAWSLYIYITRLHLNPLRWKFTKTVFIKLMGDSWPFLFAGLFGYLYARIDQVMLQHYLGSTSVGLYDIAVRLTNIWSFIPAIIIASVFPAIVKARETDYLVYLKRFRALIIFTSALSLLATIFMFALAKPVILVIFGEQYIDSVPILQIYIWSAILAILGVLAQQYLITENKGRVNLLLTIIGATVNISLNLYMIPNYGMAGAAISTLFSYAMIPFGLLLFKQTRHDLRLMLKNRT